jgi:LPXTG-motif cell wall-anchored protein
MVGRRRYRYTLRDKEMLYEARNVVNKKAWFAGAIALAAVGGMSAGVPGAFAGAYPPDTTIATPSDPTPADRTPPPVETDPVILVKPNSPGALPTTGGNTGIALQIGAATMVAGMTAVVAVRRRRPIPA